MRTPMFHPSKATVLALLMCLTHVAFAQSLPATHWVGSWASSQQIPEAQNKLPDADLHDATLRQIVHLSIGGPAIRVHLSNAFGTQPLHIASVHVAHPQSPSKPAIDPATDHAVTFAGASDVTIPAGAEYLSDAIAFPVAPLSDLAISIHFDASPSGETSHPGSRATSWVAPGDQVSAPDLPAAKPVDHWFQISGVDVAAPSNAFSIVALGDSITDGHGATTNGNDRWPDLLARRFNGASSKLSRAS